MKRLYLSCIRAIALLENALCYTGLILCSLMAFAQVVNRYFLHFEVMWIGDLTLYIFVPTMILSISLTTRAGAHTSVDVFMDLAFAGRPRARRVYAVAVDAMTLGILAYMLPMGFKIFSHAMKYPEYGTLVRWFNTSWIRQTVFLMFVLCAIHTVHRIGTGIAALRKAEPTAKEVTP
jgi:TRAP-type C4-dicarboxylate transport system permease small subunit